MKTKAPTLNQVAMVLQALTRIESWDGHHESIEDSVLDGGGWLTADVNQKKMPMPSTRLLTAVKLLARTVRV